MSLEQAKIHLEAISSSEGRPFDETLTQVIQEQNYKTALDQHAIVAVTDAAGKISHINEMFCKLSGYSRNELIGQSHIIINSTYHTKEFFKDMWKIIAKGQIWRGDICNRAKNGSIYWVRTTIVPFKDSKGKISQYISIRTDITEKIKIQEKLKATNKRLEDLYQQLEAERIALNNKNIALNEIISHIEEDKNQIKNTMKQNLETVILPLIQLIKSKKNSLREKYFELIESSLTEIAEKILPKQKDFVRILTPKEIQICKMIRSGMSVKEIAVMYSLSPRTIDKHRENIRNKLGLKAKKVNLTTYLLTSDFT